MAALAASVLDMDYSRLGEELDEICAGGLDMIHIDVMDGQFVPSMGIGTKMIDSLRQASTLFFDVHLMIKNPDRLIDRIAQAGADQIIIHYEACENVAPLLDQIHTAGKQAGLSLRPETPLNVLTDELLDKTDRVLLMTTVPGVEGQSFIPSSCERIRQLKKQLIREHPNVEIEVDGGINLSNIRQVAEAGADRIVVGRALVTGNIEENIRQLQAAIGGM